MSPLIRTLVAVVSLSFILTGCDALGFGSPPPAELAKSALTGDLVVGQSREVSVTVLDADDRAVDDVSVTWTASGDGSTSPASSRTDAEGIATTEWTFDTVAGTQTLTAEAGDIEVSFSVEVAPDALAELAVAPADTTLEAIGDTLDLTVDATDQYGNAVTTSGVAWTSSAPGIASVSGGRVIAHAQGTASITATVSDVSGAANVTVDQVVAGLDVTPAAPIMVIGESLTLTPAPVDARGNTVDSTLDASWISSNTSVATVSGTGVVNAIDVGTATVTATAGTFTDDADVDVRTGPRPTITAISPAVLAAGETATITGTGFPTDPSLVTVTVGGAAGTVLSAADTELTVEMPAPGTFPCAPTGDREVVVSVDGLDASTIHPVAGAPQHSLAVGGSTALFGSAVACNEISEPGTYVISVFNTLESATATSAFRLQGTGSSTALRTSAARPRIETQASAPAPETDPMVLGHLEVLERNLRLVEELGSPRQSAESASRIAAPQQVGDQRTFRIPDIEADDACAGYIEVTARAAYVGTHGVIWEDTESLLAGSIDDHWEEIGTEYDQVMHQILLDNFGDPLVYDDRLDANGRFFMLFSEAVNDFQSPAVNGFVFSGDFFPRSGGQVNCASSDEGEIFYGRVPTSSSSGFDQDNSTTTVDEWGWQMRSTIIHEVKHVTAFANKFDADASTFEATGLEESTARLAEEFYGRALQNYGQNQNVGYQESIYCEIRVGANFPSCDPIPIIMIKHYSDIERYLRTPTRLSPFGPVSGSDASFYGSGWQWVRWAIDQSGQPEADVIKAMIREQTLTGPANLADKVGRSVEELLADYTLAFVVDDHPSGVTPARSQLTMPSWDTRDIFVGLNDDFPDSYTNPWPLSSTSLTGGDFQVAVPEIHGGSASIFELSGMSGPQLLELLSESGNTAPTSLGLAIVRIQ